MAPLEAASLLLLLAGSSTCLLLPEPLQTRPLFSGRAQQTVCVDIPRNLSLCHGVGYTTMRLPNLLEHDTMEEVAQQSAAWLPLMHIGCHVDARLFLCSLFSPVCLERDIWPCRSLCRTVQRGCEGQMLVHGFPWPDIFRCDRFPVDNDMCIPSQNPDPESAREAAGAASAAQNTADTAVENVASGDTVPDAYDATLQHRNGKKRGVCSQPSTFESVVEHLCRAEIAIRARVGQSTSTLRNAELIKGPGRQSPRQQAPVLLSRPMVLDESCSGRLEPRRAYLIAGHATVKGAGGGGGGGRRFNPTIVVPWPAAAKAVKRAIAEIINSPNCTSNDHIFFLPAVKFKLTFPRHSGRHKGRSTTTTSTTTTTTTTSLPTTIPSTTTSLPTTIPSTTTTIQTTTVPTVTSIASTTSTIVPTTTTDVITTTLAATTTPAPTTTTIATTTTTPVPTTTTTTTTTTSTAPTTTLKPSSQRPRYSDVFRHRQGSFLPNSREDMTSGGRAGDVSIPRRRGKKKHRQGKKKKERRRKLGGSTMAPPDSRVPGASLPSFQSEILRRPIRRGYH